MGAMYRMGPCGANGGSPRDMDMNGVTRIVMIRINSSLAVDSLSILVERNGLQEWIPRWGGPGGNETEIRLGENEYLTNMTGHLSPHQNTFMVRSLVFVTNLRRFGPFGGEEGLPFELPAAGGRILGLHGRSGQFIDAIGTYVQMP